MPFSLPFPLSITRLNFSLVATLVLLTRGSLLALAKSMYYINIKRGGRTRGEPPFGRACDPNRDDRRLCTDVPLFSEEGGKSVHRLSHP